MNKPTTQQRLATAIGTVIIPMVETGDGIYDGPIQEFLSMQANIILWNLESNFDNYMLKPKQP